MEIILGIIIVVTFFLGVFAGRPRDQGLPTQVDVTECHEDTLSCDLAEMGRLELGEIYTLPRSLVTVQIIKTPDGELSEYSPAEECRENWAGQKVLHMLPWRTLEKGDLLYVRRPQNADL